MKRTLRHFLVAAALVLGQHAAQLHALSHLRQDPAECDGKCVPPGNQPSAQCLAYHVVGSALPAFCLALEPAQTTLPAPASVALPLPFAPRIEFDSRAPPPLS
jgi:hypothetical protein